MKVAVSEYLKLKLELLGITETDLAYMAGLMDGEGCFDFRVVEKHGEGLHGHCVSSGMTITNTHKGVLDWVKGKFDGDVYYHATDNKYGIYFWQLRKREQLKWIIPAILPYLIIKKPQAELYLKGIHLIKANLGTRKGISRANATICHPKEYWDALSEVERLLKHSKHEYKHLSEA